MLPRGFAGRGGKMWGGWNGGGATSAAAPADAPPSSGVCAPGLHPACAFCPARPHALAVCTQVSPLTHGQLSVAHALRRLRPFCLSHVSPGTIFPRTVPLLSDLPPLSFSLIALGSRRPPPMNAASPGQCSSAPRVRRKTQSSPATPALSPKSPPSPERRQKARRIETPGPVQPCRPHEKAGRVLHRNAPKRARLCLLPRSAENYSLF